MFSKIYAITPNVDLNRTLDLQNIATILTRHNINILQYRCKNSQANIKTLEAVKLLKICKNLGIQLIINDDMHLAAEVGADGVHLGKNDGDIADARKLLGSEAIIGASCYNDINIAIQAEKRGVNYCGFGSVFSSITKPNTPKCSLKIITQAASILSVPVVAIGGITFENCQQVFDSGASSVAMISGLWASELNV